MAVQHSSAITTAWSRLRESAYGTPRASGDDYRRLISETRNVVNDELSFGNDGGYETGVDIPTEYWGETANTSFDANPKFNFQDIGYMLDMALGGYAVSGPDGGLYTHTFTPQDMSVSRQMPSRTGLKDQGPLLMLPSLVSTAFSIVFGKMGRISTSMSLTGNGDINEDPGGYAMPALTAGGTREYGYASQASGISLSVAGTGTRQKITATGVGTTSGAGDAAITVTAAGLTGSPIVLAVAVGAEAPSVWVPKIRTALRANSVIAQFFDVTGSGANIVMEARNKAANDATMNLAIATGTATGITAAPTATQTTAGVAGTSEAFGCLIEEGSLNLNTPSADDGYRICSSYLDPANPMSGQLRAEFLAGIREMNFSFTARDNGTSNLRTWMREQTDLELHLPIIGTEANDYSLRISHLRCRVISQQGTTSAGGDFIGKSGTLALLGSAAGDGTIPLTATLVNNVASYAS